MATHAELDKQINQDILQGKALEAFEAHYAEDVVMQENTDELRVGKELNRAHELQFFGSIEAFFGAELVAESFASDVGFSEWMWDFQMKGMPRMQMNQVAVRKWRDGKVVHERFYHK